MSAPSLAERAQMATARRQAMAAQRADLLRRMIAEGECKKRAAFLVGVSLRTATRYRAAAS